MFCDQQTVWGLVCLTDGFTWQCSQCGMSGPHEPSADLAWERVRQNSEFVRIPNLIGKLQSEVDAHKATDAMRRNTDA
jgi:hypothetical protein